MLTLHLNRDEVQILQSALYEYRSHRLLPTVKDYVAQRYPVSDPGYSPGFCDSKIKAVTEKAEALRNRLFPHGSESELFVFTIPGEPGFYAEHVFFNKGEHDSAINGFKSELGDVEIVEAFSGPVG